MSLQKCNHCGAEVESNRNNCPQCFAEFAGEELSRASEEIETLAGDVTSLLGGVGVDHTQAFHVHTQPFRHECLDCGHRWGSSYDDDTCPACRKHTISTRSVPYHPSWDRRQGYSFGEADLEGAVKELNHKLDMQGLRLDILTTRVDSFNKRLDAILLELASAGAERSKDTPLQGRHCNCKDAVYESWSPTGSTGGTNYAICNQCGLPPAPREEAGI